MEGDGEGSGIGRARGLVSCSEKGGRRSHTLLVAPCGHGLRHRLTKLCTLAVAALFPTIFLRLQAIDLLDAQPRD